MRIIAYRDNGTRPKMGAFPISERTTRLTRRGPLYVTPEDKGSLDGQSVSGETSLQKWLQLRALVLNNICSFQPLSASLDS
jgi:hypothetical protein